MTRALAIVAVLLATAAPIGATTYRWVDERGNVHYSHRPPPGSTPAAPGTAPVEVQREAPSVSPSAPAPAAPPAAPQRPSPSPQGARAPSSPAPPAPSAPPASPMPTRAVPPAITGEPGDALGVQARELIELSGMGRHLKSLADLGQRTVAAGAWRRRDANRVWMLLMPLLRRETMMKPATACLARHLPTGHGAEVLAWFRSPLGDKIQKLEAGVADDEDHLEYRKFVNHLPEGKIAQARLELLQSMAERGRIAEQATEVRWAIEAAIHRVLGQRSEEEYGESPTRLAAEEHTRFWAVTSMLFAYQNLTDAELQAFDRFDRTPASGWFTAIYWGCLHEAVKAIEQRAAEALKTSRVAGRASPAAR